jgi:hypothetical protein
MILNIFHGIYVPRELIPAYNELMKLTCYYGIEHMSHDCSFSFPNRSHVFSPTPTNPHRRLKVSGVLSTFVCAETGLIASCQIIPGQGLEHTLKQILQHLSGQAKLLPQQRTRIRSIGIDNAKSQAKGFLNTIYQYMMHDHIKLFDKSIRDHWKRYQDAYTLRQHQYRPQQQTAVPSSFFVHNALANSPIRITPTSSSSSTSFSSTSPAGGSRSVSRAPSSPKVWIQKGWTILQSMLQQHLGSLFSSPKPKKTRTNTVQRQQQQQSSELSNGPTAADLDGSIISFIDHHYDDERILCTDDLFHVKERVNRGSHKWHPQYGSCRSFTEKLFEPIRGEAGKASDQEVSAPYQSRADTRRGVFKILVQYGQPRITEEEEPDALRRFYRSDPTMHDDRHDYDSEVDEKDQHEVTDAVSRMSVSTPLLEQASTYRGSKARFEDDGVERVIRDCYDSETGERRYEVKIKGIAAHQHVKFCDLVTPWSYNRSLMSNPIQHTIDATSSVERGRNTQCIQYYGQCTICTQHH